MFIKTAYYTFSRQRQNTGAGFERYSVSGLQYFSNILETGLCFY
jgi:hypothetical protein